MKCAEVMIENFDLNERIPTDAVISKIQYEWKELGKYTNPLAHCEPSKEELPWKKKPCKCPVKKKEEEKEYTMYDMEIDQRNHMKRRLDVAKSDKVEETKKKFHMTQINPQTKDAVLAAIKAGQLTIDPDYYTEDGKNRYGHFAANTLVFTDPERDEEGYKAAKATLDKAFTAAKDQIIVLPLADGLKALQTFEATTF